jgi:D-sedoheptulose 7-phosphate isomerase
VTSAKEGGIAMDHTASYASRFLQEVGQVAAGIDPAKVDQMVEMLGQLRDTGGRLFIIGLGGGAGHASHAVNDFRKLCGIDALSPLDNVSELTARINDDGWETCLVDSLKTSRMSADDALLVFSVGGGSRESGLSLNIVVAVEHAKEIGAQVLGIVGRREGTTAAVGDCVIVLDSCPPEMMTPLVEGFQAVLWHALVSHPRLRLKSGTWEAVIASSPH